MRITDGKRCGVEALRSLNFTVVAIGDAYNDSAMLTAAHFGFWVHAPNIVLNDFPHFPSASGYVELLEMIEKTIAGSNHVGSTAAH
jgi:phosphoserine/homoserine phosphotransferase